MLSFGKETIDQCLRIVANIFGAHLQSTVNIHAALIQ